VLDKTTARRAREREKKKPVLVRDTSAVASIEPRRRSGRLLVLKIVVGVVLIGATVVLGGKWLLHQSIFRVQHVALTGEAHETAAEILSVTHLDAHPAMIDLSATTVQRELGAYPWIGSISLTKRWPNTVDLAVHEVAAVAVAFDAQHVLRFVSAGGRDLSSAPLSTNMPTLVTTPASLAATAWPFEGRESSAAVVASQLPAAFASQVSQVIVDAQGNVTLQMTTPIKFFLGPTSNLNAKFVAVAASIAHGTFVAGDIVDVTTPSELSVTGPAPS
jgi:cell division protein FtsQ